jgi:UDP-N-acetylmuramoyl-tripeptide--D-alanyl-D-alanine ligase
MAKACGGKLMLGDKPGSATANQNVTSVVIDSRQVTEGGAFVAVCGERVDGHKFISQIFEKGAAVAITEKTPDLVAQENGIDCSDWGSYILVENSLQALKEIGEFYRCKLGTKVVGITGSVGKTSTKEFIAGVLAEGFCVLKTEGNFNNEIGVPLTLLRLRDEHEVAVIEMGISEFGEMHRLSKMARPDVCVITNIGQCHLENLKTRDGILQAKTEIFDFMAEDAKICLNGMDDKLQTLRDVKGHDVHFFGLEEETPSVNYDVMATKVHSHGLWGSDAVLVCGAETEIPVHVTLPGEHMVLNAAAAACVARLFGLSDEKIAEGIAKVAPVSGRTNLIRCADYTLIDDCYNANPVSVKSALDLLAQADTAKVAILGDMFELGVHEKTLHAEVGTYAAAKAIDHIICVGTLSEHMAKEAEAAGATQAADAAQAVDAAQAADAASVSYFRTREALLEALAKERAALIPGGATVLIKASHGMHFEEIVKYLQQ